MEMRMFGRTGMRFSVLGFGCGAVGGLIVRGDQADQERTIARAIAAGVNYFDTAVQYGNGESEKNLGRVLQRLKPANVVVGTKVRVPSGDGSIANAVARSLEGSLVRLRLDRIDIFHLHNAITETGGGEALSVRQVLGDVVPAFECAHGSTCARQPPRRARKSIVMFASFNSSRTIMASKATVSRFAGRRRLRSRGRSDFI
jgi:aryl-alcohol dehydrogenase-like predicted oxidoreductase